MKSQVEKEEVLKLRLQGFSYGEISKKMKISRNSVHGICLNRNVLHPKKRGRKAILTQPHKLQIKRQISIMKQKNEKVNSRKLKEICDLPASRFTICRHLKAINMKYEIIRKIIPLKLQDKNERVKLAKQWLIENHPWEKTIFSDEKWFSFDGPDGWSSFMYPNEEHHRPRRQKGGGGVMVWAMVLPSGLISYKFLDRKFKSPDYIDILQNIVVPISKMNFRGRFWFQQDNSRIHTSKLVKQWMESASLSVINWPVRSPDLNIAENIWKIIEDQVYDCSPFHTRKHLMDSIEAAILQINSGKRDVICKMYESYRKRLIDVIDKCGNTI